MTTTLFIAEALLAGVFTLAGGAKLLVPREALQKKMHWAASWRRWQIKLLGLAEVLGGMALVLPGATGTLLSPMAAVCLAVLMAGAVATHRRLGERFLPAVIVGLLCLFVGVVHSYRLQSVHRVTSAHFPAQGADQRVSAVPGLCDGRTHSWRPKP